MPNKREILDEIEKKIQAYRKRGLSKKQKDNFLIEIFAFDKLLRKKSGIKNVKQTTIFREALGNSPVIRVLDFLIEGRGLDYSLSDIAKNSNIGWTTLHRIWGKLLKLKIITPTREIGRAKLFKLNEENHAVKELIRLYDTLLYQETEKYFSKELEIAV